jgi:hypothetical protein
MNAHAEEHTDLRVEVRHWVEENFPASLRAPEKQEQYYQS